MTRSIGDDNQIRGDFNLRILPIICTAWDGTSSSLYYRPCFCRPPHPERAVDELGVGYGISQIHWL